MTTILGLGSRWTSEWSRCLVMRSWIRFPTLFLGIFQSALDLKRDWPNFERTIRKLMNWKVAVWNMIKKVYIKKTWITLSLLLTCRRSLTDRCGSLRATSSKTKSFGEKKNCFKLSTTFLSNHQFFNIRHIYVDWWLTIFLKEPRGSMPHSQGLSNISLSWVESTKFLVFL